MIKNILWTIAGMIPVQLYVIYVIYARIWEQHDYLVGIGFCACLLFFGEIYKAKVK